MSEQDRMMARPAEFATTTRSASAWNCWQDWNVSQTTAHDGLIRDGHPMLDRALSQLHSATSLKMLLRNPLGFTWRYALGWREPDRNGEAMDLDPLGFGDLVHEILDTALGAAGWIDTARGEAIAATVSAARASVAARWEAERPVPPAILWAMRLDEAEEMSRVALAWPLTAYPGQASFGELPFGNTKAEHPDAPWDATQAVRVPGTGLRIHGWIDRLDLAKDRRAARVIDYKTGKQKNPGILAGGSELQRCLYAYAVHALLGPEIEVETALLYLQGDNPTYRPLDDTTGALETLTRALLLARDSLLAGRALMGPDTGGDYDDLRFALPASPGAMIDRKRISARICLGDAALIWEVP